jgi:hypothetical protein
VILLLRTEIRRLMSRDSFRVAVLLSAIAALGATVYFMVATEAPTGETDEFFREHRSSLEERIDFCTEPPDLPEEPEFGEGEPRPPEEVLERSRAQRSRARSRRECMEHVNRFEAAVGPVVTQTVTDREGNVRPLAFRQTVSLFHVAGALTSSFRWIPYAGFLVAFLIGATFGGADWSGGWMKTYLTWESRRPRIYLAKAVALVFTVVGLYVLAQVLMALFVTLGALVKGSFVGFDAVMWEDLLESSWRGWFMTAIGGLLGFALPFGFRYTMAAPVGLAIFLVAEVSLLNLTQEFRTWSLAASFVVAGKGYDIEALYSQTPAKATALLAAAALVISIFSTILFARRDVMS